MVNKKKVVVVGAGIVGLAHALASAKAGYDVTVIERNEKAVGASIRNFGMVWPIGQPPGHKLIRALRSREIWKEIASGTNIFLDEVGSIHAAYRDDELQVLIEFYEQNKQSNYQLEWINPDNLGLYTSSLKQLGFAGGIYSRTEMIVDPRQAIAEIPNYLTEQYGVEFIWNTAVSKIKEDKLTTSRGKYNADHIYVCSGADFENLYPEVFRNIEITKCKLQMMRTAPQAYGWRLGAAVAGGLTLTHYKAFESCPSLAALKQRIETETPHFPEWGIHVMASQNGLGEVIIGDSHEYGLTPDPFDRQLVNGHILGYLRSMLDLPNAVISETWNGVYPKMTDGTSEFVHHIEENVTIVNGLGGAGMTLSFGLAEEVVNGVFDNHRVE